MIPWPAATLVAYCTLASAAVAPDAPPGDDLPRRATMGVAIALADRTKPADPRRNPVVVVKAMDGGAGAAAGVRAGDVVEALDGEPIGTPEALVAAVRRHRGGDVVQLALRRAGAPLRLAVALRPRPYETSPSGEVLYRSVTVRGARRRVIVTRPRGDGRHPAVLVIGGLGCYSLDHADRSGGYGRVIAALTERGFATMRVEKPGQGDSEGPDCHDPAATPQLEADGYLAGLRALKSYAFVDGAKVFVFAHSLGPIIGSLALTEEPVRGVVAVETVGRSWFEYDLERVRLQAALRGTAYDEVDRIVREYEACSHRFFVEKQAPEVLRRTPACAAVLDPLASVPATYMQQVADINLPRQWRRIDAPVLVVHGTASPVTTASEGRYLAEVINSFHPGRARYVEVPGMGHDLARYASPREYLQRREGAPPPFHEGLLDVVCGWLDEQLRG